MDRLRFHRVETLFDEAVDVPPAEREAFIRQACRDAPDLIPEVLRLLENVDRPVEIDGAWRPHDVDLAPGTEIGLYRLVKKLGEGGFGVVHLAHQERPVRRDVALKILKRGMDSRQVLARFESEREALARMDHPNIAHVLDAGVSADGRPYFVMDLVSGADITAFCDSRRLETKERLELWLQVCAAVSHAHRKGIVHRDLKPSNVLVSYEGGEVRCRVIDFGIARALADGGVNRTRVTQPDQLVGTPVYMSPEQAAGSPDVDTRTDIYALGILLYEFLTDTTPHEPPGSETCSAQEIRRRIEERDPARPSVRLVDMGDRASVVAQSRRTDTGSLRRVLRGDLDWIVMKAIDKDPDRRYATADAFGDDVRRYLRREPVEAGPPGTGYRVRRFVSRHRVAVTAVTCVLLAVLAGAALSTVGFVTAARQRDHAHERLYDAYVAQIEQLRSSRTLGRKAESLRIVGQAAALRPSADLRETAIACMTMTDLVLDRVIPLAGTAGRVTSYGLREIDRVAHADPDGTVIVCHLIDGTAIARLSGPVETPWTFVFSPEGTYLAVKYHEGNTIHIVVWNVATAQQVVTLLNMHNVLSATIAFASDESFVAFGGPGHSVQRHALPAGGRLPDIPLEGRALAIAVSPRDPWMAVAIADDPTLPIFDLDDHTLVKTLVATHPVVAVAFARDGSRLATGAVTGELAVWDTANAHLLVTLHGHQGRPRRLEFNETGERLASNAWDSTARVWDAVRGNEIVEPFRGVSFAGFGEDLLLSDPRGVAVWRDATSSTWRELAISGDQGEVPALAVAADGRLAAVAGENGVRLCDLDAGVEVGRLVPDVHVHSVAFDRAGDLVGATDHGVLAWPVHSSDSTLTVGRSRQVATSRGVTRICLDSAGRLLVCDAQIRLVDLETPERSVRFDGRNAWGSTPAVSGDGDWLFTGTWKGPPGRLWDTRSETVVRTFEASSVAGAFDPSGRYLVVAQGPIYRFLDVTTWDERWSLTCDTSSRLAGPIAFDPYGLAAVVIASGSIGLVDLDRLEVVAVLPAPRGQRVRELTFTPDGSTLLVASRARSPLQLWDLHAVRRELGELGLDWYGPGPPPTRPVNEALRFEGP